MNGMVDCPTTESLRCCDSHLVNLNLLCRAPFLIICLNTPDSGENITLVLPEVCKDGDVVHNQKREDDISPKECCQSIAKFHRVIASGEGIVANEVKVRKGPLSLFVYVRFIISSYCRK